MLSRNTGALQGLAQQRDYAVGMQSLLAQMAPAVNTPKYRPANQRGFSDPLNVGLHRTQTLQGWRLVRLPEVVAVALAARQVKGDA